MNLKPHALDQWLQGHAAEAEFDLGSSTGPHWKLRDLLSLDSGNALERLLDTELIYSRTAGGTALREAIAEMQGVPSEHVLVMAGGAEALWHLFMIAAEPGANVIVPFPCFPPHRTMPEALGLEVRLYRLRRDHAWRIDLDELQDLADARTKLVLANLPNNPTGAMLSDTELNALHDFCVERGIQFVCDEVHHPICHARQTASAARLPHATTIGDFSKAFSLSGLRLGWMVEPDANRREQYLNAREYVTISNTPIAELAAEIAVKYRETVLGRTRDVTRANLPLLDNLVAQYQEVIRWVRPEGGMTAFPWLVEQADARAFCRAAIRHGVLLAPGECFGMPQHFRIGFGVSDEWFPRAMERLADLLHTWARAEHAEQAGGRADAA